MTFAERAKIAQENLAKQKPISLEQIREQAKRVLERTNGKNNKGGLNKGSDSSELQK